MAKQPSTPNTGQPETTVSFRAKVVLGLFLVGAMIASVLALVLGNDSRVNPKLYQNPSDFESVTHYRGASCGVERWSVKTLSDPAAGQVNLNATRARVVDLVKLPAPQLPRDNTTRLPQEMKTVWISGTHLIEYKRENDSDIHLVLRSPLNGATMIAEIPDPSCVASPTARALIDKARQSFVAQVGNPTGSFTHVDKEIYLKGVEFYDFPHGQTGVAPNAIELHPVLSFKVQ